MLLPSFFIVDFTKYDNLPDVQLPENTYISYKITAPSIHLIDSFYKKLFLLPGKYPFCLLITLENELLNSDAWYDDIIDLLVAFSFHSKYIKPKGDNPLLLIESNNTDVNKYISIIGEAFKSHGYNSIETVIIDNHVVSSPKKNRKNICFNLQKNNDSFYADYIGSIKQITSSDSSFFFFCDSPEMIPEILDTIQKAEAILCKDSPQVYFLLNENISLRTRENELLLNIELLHERLESIYNYNSSDIRYKRQITELLKYYKYEYEILPLWFKRVGHIIKVVMGKRTFRSLFNDKVKKYKD